MSTHPEQGKGTAEPGRPLGTVYLLPPPHPAESEYIDLGALLDLIRKGWRTIAVSTAVCTLLATAVAWWLTPVYEATASAVISSTDKSSQMASSLAGGLASLAGISIGAEASPKAEALAVLTSRSFLKPFLEERNLLPALFPGLWDPATKAWTVEGDEVPTYEDGYRKFTEKVLRVGEDVSTGVVSVTIAWRDPVVAATWANELTSRVNERMRAIAIEESERSVEYLREQIEATSVADMQQMLYGMIEGQLQRATLARARKDFVFRVYDPAVPPDIDNFVRPRRLVLGILGVFFGLFLGAGIVVMRGIFAAPRTTDA